jgi:flagellar M-ring protein FliF
MPSNEFQNQVVKFLMSLSVGKKITLTLLVVGTIIGLTGIMMWAGKPNFQVLYSNLSSEDAGVILSKLKDRKTPYQISSDGKSILVPRENIYETRLNLASEGLPQGGGVGFEIFDNTKLGVTEFVQKINYQRALQGELSRTINKFEAVESSRVHIVMPTRSVFVEEDKPATASVSLKLIQGRSLTKAEVKGIVHLLSSSVSGLPPQNITVVNNYGQMISGFMNRNDQGLGQITSDQLKFQDTVERNLEKRLETMLEEALGSEKAIVRVSCSFDFRKQEKTEERFSPNNVVRSEQVLKEISNEVQNMPAGMPGVVANITPGGLSGAGKVRNQGKKEPKFQKEDKTINYEVSKIVSHTVEPSGVVTKLAVAVLIDGAYKKVEIKAGEKGRKQNVTEKQEAGGINLEYIPRSQEEIKKIESLVKCAVNFDADRGDEIKVINIPFESTRLKLSEEKIPEEGFSSRLIYNTPLIKYCFSGLAILLLFLFIIRPLIKWLTGNGVTDQELLKQLPMTVQELEGAGAGIPLDEAALQMLTGDADSSLNLLRKEWMSENA